MVVCCLTRSATHVHCLGRMKSEIAPGTLAGQLETILVVDDNESVLSVVVALLKRANFQVLSADNGANAIELARKTEGQSTCSFPTWTCPSCQVRTSAKP